MHEQVLLMLDELIKNKDVRTKEQIEEYRNKILQLYKDKGEKEI